MTEAGPPGMSTGGKIALAAGGLAAALCLIVTVAVIYFFNSRAAAARAPRPAPLLATSAVQAPTAPSSGQAASASPAPTPAALESTLLPAETGIESDGAWSADVGQLNEEARFADDFSAPVFEWAEVSEELGSWNIQDGRYALRMAQPDFRAWAFVPVDFQPLWVEFDAAVLPGRSQGGYGVLCGFRDADDFFYVTIDVVSARYSLAHHIAGGDTNLMSEWWNPARFLHGSPLAVNRVRVECAPDHIALYLNGRLEAQHNIGPVDPPDPGDAPRLAIFGQTWEDMPEQGLEVWFDNVTAGK